MEDYPTPRPPPPHARVARTTSRLAAVRAASPAAAPVASDRRREPARFGWLMLIGGAAALWTGGFVAGAAGGVHLDVATSIAIAAHLALVAAASVAARQAWHLQHALYASRRLGNYRLMSPLGGGMSEVWLAWDELRRREVALKLLRTTGTPEATRARFAREVELVRGLRSPHLTRVHEFGVTDDGYAYIAFEYLRGMDLEALVGAFGPLEPARAVQLFIGACRGLGVAHRVGVLHRDVKPANLHCSDRKGEEDHVRILDFGVSRAIDEAGVTLDGTAVGTPAYMSPEAFDGTATPASDVYAIGASLYFALTGVPPFDGATAGELRGAHQRAPLVPPSLRASVDLPGSLERVILRCLAKAPAKRYRDADEVGAALEACARLLPAWKPEDAARWWHQARVGRISTRMPTQQRTTEVEAVPHR